MLCAAAMFLWRKNSRNYVNCILFCFYRIGGIDSVSSDVTDTSQQTSESDVMTSSTSAKDTKQKRNVAEVVAGGDAPMTSDARLRIDVTSLPVSNAADAAAVTVVDAERCSNNSDSGEKTPPLVPLFPCFTVTFSSPFTRTFILFSPRSSYYA